MGSYLNPGHDDFQALVNYEYVDKSGLAGEVNRTIETPYRLSCVSRPRRFGKSVAAQMLAAYYGRAYDTSTLFAGLELSQDPTYRRHLNQYNVILLDMAAMGTLAGGYDQLPRFIHSIISKELQEELPDLRLEDDLPGTLFNAAKLAKTKFVMLIDEWDAPIREAEDEAAVRNYLFFLRSLFKNTALTGAIFAAVYMTGILPVKRYGSQSALSNFQEYTILKPQQFAPYVGFLEPEVRALCERHGRSYAEMKRWYDGYSLPGGMEVYNPNSVMRASQTGDFCSYWSKTSAANVLIHYIGLDFEGLAKTVAEVLGGGEVPVRDTHFANDMREYASRDDVLTTLVHLGYLTYNDERGTVRIPNEEVREEFADAIHYVSHDATARRVAESVQLFKDTVAGRAEAVAAQLERIHAEECAPLHYNNEQSLRAVIKLAYYTYKDNYLQFEELPAGAGYADIVYLPRKHSGWPALLVELKWNQSAETAIAQVKARSYPAALKGYGGQLVMVGVSYDKDAPPGERRHTATIETIEI